jgi:hypothetical protein
MGHLSHMTGHTYSQSCIVAACAAAAAAAALQRWVRLLLTALLMTTPTLPWVI